MDSPPLAGPPHASTSIKRAGSEPLLPRSELDALSAVEVGQVQTELATELYGFAPLAFTSRVVDLANDVIYDVVDKVEAEVMRKWAPEDGQGEPADEERREAVAKGVNRLETLLMGAVDIRFDQAETWLVRNTFKVPSDLIPYILLPHHPPEGFAGYSKKGEDDAAMRALERELAAVNGLREELALLDTVEERVQRRVVALRKMKSSLAEILTAGGARDTLSAQSKSLAVSVPSYISYLKPLLASAPHRPSSRVQASSDAPQQPWKHSREGYLSWLAQKVLDETVARGDGEGDARIEGVARELATQGSAREARSLKSLVEA